MSLSTVMEKATQILKVAKASYEQNGLKPLRGNYFVPQENACCVLTACYLNNHLKSKIVDEENHFRKADWTYWLVKDLAKEYELQRAYMDAIIFGFDNENWEDCDCLQDSFDSVEEKENVKEVYELAKAFGKEIFGEAAPVSL